MNRNTAIALVVGVLIIVAGVVYVVSGSKTAPTTVVVTDNPTSGTQNTNPATAPVNRQAGAPIALTSSTVYPTDTTAILTGTVTPNGAFTNYWYEFSTTPNLGARTSAQMLGAGYYNLSAPTYITGLTKNTTYYFRLVAENQYDRSVGVQYSFKTTSGVSAPEGSAPAVRTLSVSDISNTTATLNGEVTPNKANTTYWFEYGQNANMGNSTIATPAGTGSIKLNKSVAISNLAPLTTYYYRINAQNQFGTVNGSIQNFKTSGPASPSVPTIKTSGATQIKDASGQLNGTVSANGKETRYWFEYSTDSLLGSVLMKQTDRLTLASDARNVDVKSTISDLNSKTTYYFRLVAENDMGIVRGDRQSFKTK